VLQGAVIVGEETPSQQQVLWRIAGDGELGKGNDVGAGVAGLRGVIEYLTGVALEVPDCRVDLGERDS
jgi:hypothetical protein